MLACSLIVTLMCYLDQSMLVLDIIVVYCVSSNSRCTHSGFMCMNVIVSLTWFCPSSIWDTINHIIKLSMKLTTNVNYEEKVNIYINGCTVVFSFSKKTFYLCISDDVILRIPSARELDVVERAGELLLVQLVDRQVYCV